MYHTQMEAARKGIITKEMEIVAEKEFRTEEEIRISLQKDRWQSVPINDILVLTQTE